MKQNDLLSSLFGPDLAQKMQGGAEDYAATVGVEKEKIAEIKDRAVSVFSSEAGQQLLRDLTLITYSKPSYPPPDGLDAGEYAAMCEGQRKIVALLINWSIQE